MARSTSGESVLERAMRILEQFGPEQPELTTAAIARGAGLPMSTAHRLVEELVRHGLLTRTEGRGVRVGVRLWELSVRSSTVQVLREAALPAMEDLHAVVQQHVSLGVLDGADVLYLERLSAPDAITNLTKVAGRLPAHAVSSGHVLLAHAPEAVREAFLARPLEAVTDRTLTDPRALRRAFADVRRLGYAVTVGQVEVAGTGVAAPVRRRDGVVVAAMSLTVPAGMGAQRLVPALLTATRGVSRALGHVEHRDRATVRTGHLGTR